MSCTTQVRRQLGRGGARMRGLSLVELMIGIAVGLFIVAAATVLVTGQLGENRRLMLDTQLQQDLRATADIITRELRRVGAWRSAELGISHPTVAASENNMANSMTPSAAGTLNPAELVFRYDRSTTEQGPWGFRLVTATGVIQTRLGPLTPLVPWQDLTDRNVIQVTSFTVAIEREPGQELPCPNLCPTTGDTSCWPVLQVRNFVINITARSTADASITRSIRSVARARNDWVEFRTAGTIKPACPT
jgi:type IV pilus assembly protein PilW